MFISSWVLPRGGCQYPSHVVSALFMAKDEHRSYMTTHKYTGKDYLEEVANSVFTNCSLDFAHDLVVGNCSPTLVVSNDLRLFINFLRKK